MSMVVNGSDFIVLLLESLGDGVFAYTGLTVDVDYCREHGG